VTAQTEVEVDVTAGSYGLVAAGAVSYACLTFVWFSLPAYLAPLIEEVGLTGAQAGVLAGAVPLTYVPLALLTGLAVDRVGPVWSIAAGLVTFGLAQVGRSVATGFPTLLATTLLIGVGATAITFGLPKLVSVSFPPDRTGAPSSIYLVGASAGTAGAFALGRPVLGPLLGGWRPLFLWSGLVAVGYAAVWLLAARLVTVPEHGGDARDGHGDGEDDTGGDGRDADTDGSRVNESGFSLDSLGRDVRTILAHRELRLVVVVGTMYLLVIHGMQGWLPTVLEARGLAADLAGGTTSLLVAANVVGILVVPPVADRLSARREAVMGCGLAAFVGGLAIVAGGVGPLTAAGVVATGVGVGGLAPLVRAIPAELEGIGARLTGAAVGFVFAVGELGGFLGPVLVGTLFDLTGSYAPGLLTLASGGVVVVLVGVAMREA